MLPLVTKPCNGLTISPQSRLTVLSMPSISVFPALTNWLPCWTIWLLNSVRNRATSALTPGTRFERTPISELNARSAERSCVVPLVGSTALAKVGGRNVVWTWPNSMLPR